MAKHGPLAVDGFLADLRECFHEGFHSAPSLRYAVIEGVGRYWPETVAWLEKELAQGKPEGEPRIEKFAAQFFFGESLEQLKLFRSCAELAVRAIKSTAPDLRLGLPEPHSFAGEEAFEHEWMFWVLALSARAKSPFLNVIRFPLEFREDPDGLGELLWLPSGGIPARYVPPDVAFTLRGDATPKGPPKEIVLLDADVWHASIAALGALPPSPKSAIPPDLKPRHRPVEYDEDHDKRIHDAWHSNRHKTKADLASAFGITLHDAKLALDRHRKRLEKMTSE